MICSILVSSIYLVNSVRASYYNSDGRPVRRDLPMGFNKGIRLAQYSRQKVTAVFFPSSYFVVCFEALSGCSIYPPGAAQIAVLSTLILAYVSHYGPLIETLSDPA
jgi:hypothetical protein